MAVKKTKVLEEQSKSDRQDQNEDSKEAGGVSTKKNGKTEGEKKRLRIVTGG